MYNICMAESILQNSDVKGSLPHVSVCTCVYASAEMGRLGKYRWKVKNDFVCLYKHNKQLY